MPESVRNGRVVISAKTTSADELVKISKYLNSKYFAVYSENKRRRGLQGSAILARIFE